MIANENYIFLAIGKASNLSHLQVVAGWVDDRAIHRGKLEPK